MVLRNIERQPARALISITGIALAVSVLLVGMAFLDVMERLINEQFVQTMRQDATITFVRPRSGGAVHDVAHLPGVIDVEPLRSVPVRLRAGHRTRTLSVTGLGERPRLNRVTGRDGRVHALPPGGLVVSKMLGEILALSPGDQVQLDVLEGRRPTVDATISALVDDGMGLQAYMRTDAVHRLLKEGPSLSGAYVTVDRAARDAFYRTVKLMPAVAGVALRDVMVQNFRATMAENMNLQIFVNVLFAGIIAFGVVYNAARVSLSERERELASLRVMGFTRGEISLILLGELAVLTVLALPTGALLGYGLGLLIMASLSSEVYRLTFAVSPATVAWTFLIVIVASFLSGLVVRRRLDRLDLVSVLKTRE
jgi:putative ABC transport system permease protein